MRRRPPVSTLTDTHFPYPTLFRAQDVGPPRQVLFGRVPAQEGDEVVDFRRPDGVVAAKLAYLGTGLGVLGRHRHTAEVAALVESVLQQPVGVGALVAEVDRQSILLNSGP